MERYVLVVVIVTLLNISKAEFEIPDVSIDILHPKGFAVSIPDIDGIKFVSFHANINREIESREPGAISADISKAKQGRWTYTDRQTRFRGGDKIYFWVSVDYDDGNEVTTFVKENLVLTVPGGSGGQGSQGNQGHGQGNKGNKNKDKDKDKDNSRETTTPPRTTPKVTDRPTQKVTDRTPQTPATAIPVSTCKSSPTLVNGKSSCKGKLIFEDTFKELSPDKWQPEVKFAGDPDYEFVVYQNHPENLYVSGNKLVVKPIPTEERYGAGFVTQDQGLDLGDQCTGVPESLECVQKPKAWIILPPVISAQITTRDHFTFVYGTVEVRAKLPQGDWIYPEIYLKPATDAYGPGLDSGLIRIAFSHGNNQLNQKLSGGCILGSSVVARNFGLKSIQSRNGWNDDFHIFRMEWKTDRITLSVDDHVYGNVYPPEAGFASEERQLELEDGVAERWRRGGAFAPFDKEMYIALGVGAGGQCFPDRDDGTKPWENDEPKAQLQFYKAQNNWKATWGGNSTLEVDYVKVWAL